ncbi:MAG: DNA adenine methylase [Gemmatimonadetes bacterium]|nr:DNA adenine methylase [Gemmatimonadota bacterium]MYH53673.1 DNA adenine methylase [Gemmatimonadota bacterium]MYK65096.1 DNA adenine methylase [Gemmatimonadota bacterium]
MAEHYSPLRYPGGKAKLASFVASVMRRNGHLHPEYVEPYAGGAGTALQLLFEEYADRIVINDADPRVHAFWWSVTKRTSPFIDAIRATSVTVDEWHRQREVYDKCDLRARFRLGFATFFLNRTTRSGIIHNGGPIGGYDQRGRYKIDARYNSEELIRRISRIGTYSDRIGTSADDGLALLENLAANRERATDAFVYLDPPYYVKGRQLYMNHFTPRQHEELAAFLQAGPAFSWILTYDKAPAIQRMYAGLHQLKLSLSYSASQRRRGSELLVHPPTVTITERDRLALQCGRGWRRPA